MTFARDSSRLGAVGVPTVASAQALRDLVWYSNDPPEAVHILSDDGGLFKYVSGAAPGTYTNNGGNYAGTQIIPTGGNGSKAWIRDEVQITPSMFGAVADGTTQVATAFQAILDIITGTNLTLYIPRGEYWIEKSLKVSDNTHIHFEAGAVLIHGYSASGTANATLANIDQVNGNSNIYITGLATFRDPYFTTNDPAVEWVGHQISMYKVTNFYAQHLRMKDFRSWSSHMLLYKSRIDTYEVDNEPAATNKIFGCDGLHICGGSNISVGEVFGRTGDDLFALVSTAYPGFPSEDIYDVTVGSIRGIRGHSCNLLKIIVPSGDFIIDQVRIGEVVGFGGSLRDQENNSVTKAIRIFNESNSGNIKNIHIDNISIQHPGGMAVNPTSQYVTQISGNAVNPLENVHIGKFNVETLETGDYTVSYFSYCNNLTVNNAIIKGGTIPILLKGNMNSNFHNGKLSPGTGYRSIYFSGDNSNINISGIYFNGGNSEASPIYIGSTETIISIKNNIFHVDPTAAAVFVANGATNVRVNNNEAIDSNFGNWLNGKTSTVTANNNIRNGVTYNGRGTCVDLAPTLVTHGLNKSAYNVQLSTRNLESKCYTTDVTNNTFKVNAPEGIVGTIYFDWIITEEL